MKSQGEKRLLDEVRDVMCRSLVRRKTGPGTTPGKPPWRKNRIRRFSRTKMGDGKISVDHGCFFFGGRRVISVAPQPPASSPASLKSVTSDILASIE